MGSEWMAAVVNMLDEAVVAQVNMSAGEIVGLLPSLSVNLFEALLHVLPSGSTDKGILRLEVTRPELEGLLTSFAAELRAPLGLGAVEEDGSDGDVLLQLSFCLLLALAPFVPGACDIFLVHHAGPTTYGGEQAVEVFYSALVSYDWSNGVRRLSIQDDGAFGTDEGCEHLANLLKSGHCKLQELHMVKTGTGASGMLHIARALRYNSSLTSLRIQECREVGDGGVEQLAAMLRTNSTLQKLTLSNIGMTAQGLGHLCAALQSSQQSLQATSSSPGGTLGPGLKALDISQNEIGRGGAALLGAMLANNTCLQTLRAEGCSLVEEDIDGEGHLAKGLRANSTLKKLSISDNAVGKVALLGLLVRCLATNNTSLKTLDVGNVGEMPAAEELAHMLISNRSLEKLSLRTASYDAGEWAAVIFPALGRNKALLSLDLEMCRGVGGEQVRVALFHLLRINTTIQQIRLDGTPLHRAGEAEAVRVELDRNKKFRHALSALPRVNPKSCRIILCGHAYAGKSSLFQTMKVLQSTSAVSRKRKSPPLSLSPESKRTKTESKTSGMLLGQPSRNYNMEDKELSKRTRGIEIHLLKDEDDLRISVWDFAGQREFHALHDFMFRSGDNAATLFVLTVSPIVSLSDESRAGELKLKPINELEVELQYWLRFVASTSKASADPPTVVVVITHQDTLLTVGPHVKPWLLRAQDTITCLAAKFTGRVEVRPQPFMVNALDSDDVGLMTWVTDLEKSLRSTLDGLEEEPAICNEVLRAIQHVSRRSPIISRTEFANICWDLAPHMEVEIARAGQADNDPDLLAAVKDRFGRAVVAYLHDAGEVIHDDKLDIIVSNPKGFCDGVLGQLIDLVPSSQRLGTPENALVSKNYLSSLLQEAVKSDFAIGDAVVTLDQESDPGFAHAAVPRDQKSDPCIDHVVVTPDQLITLMLLFDLCYEQTPGYPSTAYLLPAIFNDEGNKAADGIRPLTWRNLLKKKKKKKKNNYYAHDGCLKTVTFVGRRLECGDLERTFLTDSFFPRLQVVLHNHAFKQKWVKNTSSDNCMLEKNLVSIWVNGMEILIEFSGSTGYFVDILVKSSKSHEKTMEFLQPNIIGTIRTFCASQDGCQGVTLAEAIIRPECLYGGKEGNPILCIQRTDQSVLVEELRKKMGSMPDWQHCWNKVKDGAGGVVLPDGQDSGTVLLEGTKDVASGPEPKQPRVEEVCYPDDNRKQGKSRGLAIVVSMEKDRPGGGVDRGRLETLFCACGFTPAHPHVDLQSSQLVDKIKSAAEIGILEEDECFVCSINAHGGTTKDGKTFIFDEKKEKIMVMRDIIEPFRHSKHLLGKPKIFFINCCRVNSYSYSVEADHDDVQEKWSPFPPLREISDCLLVFSTSEGCPSSRLPGTGTIFVEELVDTVLTERHTKHVLDVMTLVNSRVTQVALKVKDPSTGTTNIFSQCCEVRHSFRKFLYWKGP